MSRLTTLPTIESTPAASQPLLETAKKRMGSVPNLFSVVANSPAALEGYLGLNAALAKGTLDAKTRDHKTGIVTAPIKRPAKTIEALVRLLVDVPVQGLRTTVHGNMVNARALTRVSNDDTAVFGFVHNPDYEGGRLLDLAALVLRDADISAISG